MKSRLLALALILVLISLPALAESRYSTVEMEGMPEVISETRYDNASVGFAFWYDPAFFSVLWDTLEDPQGQLMIHGNQNSGAPVFLTVELPQKTGLSGSAFLEQRPLQDGLNPASLGAIQTVMTEGGDVLMLRSASSNGSVYKYFVIQKNEKELQLFTSFPLEAAEGYGVRIDHLVSTFSIQ